MHSHLDKARRGDFLSKKLVVSSLTKRIARMAAHYARRAGVDADDLLQDAWLGLLQALPRLDLSIGDPEQFLVRQARWRLLDSIKRSRRLVSLEEASEQEDIPHDGPDMLEPLWASQFAGALSKNQQAVLTCLMAGMTWREAGAALGCSSANIAYHVRQIRREYERVMEEAAL